MPSVIKILSLEEAQKIYDSSFKDPSKEPRLAVQDEWDVYALVDGETLVWANTLDMLADEWDPVDGCWMEYDALDHFEDGEAFFEALAEALEKKRGKE